jgi:hypothetical protein
VWENRELRRIFGLEMDEETGGCKNSIMKGCRLSINIIRRTKSSRRWAGNVACNAKIKYAIRIYLGRTILTTWPAH